MHRLLIVSSIHPIPRLTTLYKVTGPQHVTQYVHAQIQAHSTMCPLNSAGKRATYYAVAAYYWYRLVSHII